MKNRNNPIVSIFTIAIFSILLLMNNMGYAQEDLTFPIPDTRQVVFYNNNEEIDEPVVGEAFYGQDASYSGYEPAYQDNGDGTVSDLVTGLMWQKSPDIDDDGDIDYDDKMSYAESMAAADTFSLAGYDDWRLPSIKEMYSVFLMSGLDPSGYGGDETDDLVPFIDTNYFDFAYGDLSAGERIIDAQMASSTLYVGTTMGGDETMFGVNFADGRIKGYPTGPMPGHTEDKQYYVMYVRGNPDYGVNLFHDNGNGTVTDSATGLMWTQDDDGEGMFWEDALSYAEAAENSGYTDWRLPNVKELQSILDYTRAPSVTNSPAIDPVFNCTAITDEGGEEDYPFYWSGSTHANMSTNNSGAWGAYLCFGTAFGFMEMPPGSGNYQLMDVHGAGAQRSDPKMGNPDDYPNGHGPQGDVVRIYNYVRLVRNIDTLTGFNENKIELDEFKVYPNPTTDNITIEAIESNLEITKLQILNLLSEVVYSKSENISSKNTIHLKDFKPGLYFVRIEMIDTVVLKKFIKN